MTKITIIQKRPYKFTPEGGGEEVSGIMYGGFLEDGKVIEFSSQNDEYEPVVAANYDQIQAISVPIKAKIFKGTVKYQEAEEEE